MTPSQPSYIAQFWCQVRHLPGSDTRELSLIQQYEEVHIRSLRRQELGMKPF